MNNQDEKFYFSTKYGVFIHKTLAVVQDENNPIYQAQLEYQRNGGVFDDIDEQYIDTSVKLPSLIEKETKLYEKRIQDGIKAVAQVSAENRVYRLSGAVSTERLNEIEALTEPVRREILAGQWVSAKRILEDIGIEALGEPPYVRYHTEITNYINENYD